MSSLGQKVCECSGRSSSNFSLGRSVVRSLMAMMLVLKTLPVSAMLVHNLGAKLWMAQLVVMSRGCKA